MTLQQIEKFNDKTLLFIKNKQAYLVGISDNTPQEWDKYLGYEISVIFNIILLIDNQVLKIDELDTVKMDIGDLTVNQTYIDYLSYNVKRELTILNISKTIDTDNFKLANKVLDYSLKYNVTDYYSAYKTMLFMEKSLEEKQEFVNKLKG
ncbi:MAG: hypothetical protein Q8J85_07265 [Sulfuricurvum sp.]|nr:hypothetical protein [Sulfuricurvum sp.]MDP3022974.1 hypothetical protein [Sulfuricurvum sp.]